MEKLPEWGNRYWSGHPGFTLGLDMAVPRDPRQRVQSGPSSPTNIYGPSGNQRFDDSIPIHRDSTVAMANVAVSTLRDSMALMNNEMRNLLVRLNAMEQNSKFLSDSLNSLIESSQTLLLIHYPQDYNLQLQIQILHHIQFHQVQH